MSYFFLLHSSVSFFFFSFFSTHSQIPVYIHEGARINHIHKALIWDLPFMHVICVILRFSLYRIFFLFFGHYVIGMNWRIRPQQFLFFFFHFYYYSLNRNLFWHSIHFYESKLQNQCFFFSYRHSKIFLE